jgi:hypothetical protein
MVMALARGATLESVLAHERTLPQSAIEQMLPVLLSGLEHAHAFGILHRDIKPENILIDEQRRPTLIDFGASRIALADRSKMTAVYTPGYAPFEQMNSDEQGPYTDIYALAATLYRCVTGNLPQPASRRASNDTFVRAVAAADGRYSPSLLRAIDAGLAFRASDRPASIAAWRDIFNAAPGQTPALTARTTQRVPPPSNTASASVRVVSPEALHRARWWPTMLAGILVAILGAGAGMFALHQYQERERRAEAAVQVARKLAEEATALSARLVADAAARRVEEAKAAQLLRLAQRFVGKWTISWRDGDYPTGLAHFATATLDAVTVTGPGSIEGQLRDYVGLGTLRAKITITTSTLTILANANSREVRLEFGPYNETSFRISGTDRGSGQEVSLSR